MVTAILIPAIFLYFYWLTRKEMKKNEAEWIALASIPEESFIQGTVLEVHGERERFYYHRFNHVLTIKIQSGNNIFFCQKVTPLIGEVDIPHVRIGGSVVLYGNWKTGSFRINRIIICK
jgi:hypothetical protein